MLKFVLPRRLSEIGRWRNGFRADQQEATQYWRYQPVWFRNIGWGWYSISGFFKSQLLHYKGVRAVMEEGIRFVLSQTFYLDGDGSYLRRSSVVLQGSPRAGSLSEHRHQSSELWRPVHLAARQQPRQLHEDGQAELWARVDHSHWLGSLETLCSDWLRSWCCYASSLIP